MQSGAEKSVIEIQEASDYSNITVIQVNPFTNAFVFSYGDGNVDGTKSVVYKHSLELMRWYVGWCAVSKHSGDVQH